MKPLSDTKRTVIVVAGPTASGKSALAVQLAQELDGVVINGDSLQLYDVLPVLTNRPSYEEMQAVPHRLFGVLSPLVAPTASWWVGQAVEAIDHALAQGKRPVIAGGTGLYLEALMQGLAPLPPVPPEIRQQVALSLDQLGRDAFHALLVRDDPLAASLDRNNTQRILRAREVWLATGRSILDWQKQPRVRQRDYSYQPILLLPDRSTLYDACDCRFPRMIEAGAIKEVDTFLKSWNGNAPAGRALGFAQIASYLEQGCPYETMIIEAQAATRHYAKRQVTWFRNRLASVAGCIVQKEADAALCLTRL